MRVLLFAAAGAALLIAGLEWRLAERGIRPTVVDSDQLWLSQRQRASDLGDRALILIGASRMQLGFDLDTARQVTGLEPVMLAVDGSSFLPILQDLAEDPRITGTVLIDYSDSVLAHSSREDAAARLRYLWRQRGDAPWWPGTQALDDWLFRPLQANLRSYADGARPIRSLVLRTGADHSAVQYLQTDLDRSRRADYSRVDVRRVYLDRVRRQLGKPAMQNMSLLELDRYERELAAEVAELPAASDAHFLSSLDNMAKWVQMLRSRGGAVVIVQFPTGKLIAEIERRVYPRERFWNQLLKRIDVTALRAMDRPTLGGFRCPDGSHLDQHDRVPFTTALLQEMAAERGAGLAD